MSNFFHGKMFAKISELDESFGPYDSLNLTDEFVVVNDNITKKITGLNLTESIVSIGNLASKAYVDAVVDGAPELLNTLNEIAAALNDDSNFASNIISSINTKLPTANFGLEFWNALAGVTTFNIVEDTNLYYTQARFDAALANKTTTALVEGDNLYFTEQRVLDAMSSQPADRLISGEYEIVLGSDGVLALSMGSNIYDDGGALRFDANKNIQLSAYDNGTPSTWTFGTDGTLTLPADPTSNNHAATKQYVDAATSGIVTDYNDLTNKPTLFDGAYSSLSGKPSLATIATSGSYNDLTNKPTLFSGSYTDLTSKPDLSLKADLSYVEAADDLLSIALDLKANTADLSLVATSGSYNDLTDIPTSALSDRLVNGSKQVVLQSNGYIRLVNGAQLYDYGSGTGNGYGITDAANGTYIGYDPSDTLGALHMDSYTGGNIRIRTTTLPNTYKDWIFESNGALTLPAVPTSANHAATKGYVDDAIVAAELDGGEF